VLLAEIPTLSGGHVLLRLTAAAALGAAIGFERELRDREAGMRTHLLVALGSCLFTLVSAYGFHEFLARGGNVVRADPSRIAAQIVTGIGFLGAGAIIRQGLSIRGLTTAATLWVVAAIGMASATGYYWAAFATTVLVLVTLWPLRVLAHHVFARLRTAEGRLTVDLRPATGAGPFLSVLEDAGARVRTLQFDETEGRRRVLADVELGPQAAPDRLVSALMDADEVLAAEWTD